LKPKSKRSSRPSKLKIDYRSIRSIDHACTGCSTVEECCCARFEVSVNKGELKRIIPFLPEAAKFCPHLKTKDGYDNVFEDGVNGLHAIETKEDGLCVFAFKTNGIIRCSLHAIEISHGLPRGSVKPQMCILWPLTFSEKGDVLTLHDNALACECSSLRNTPSKEISPELLETIEYIRLKLRNNQNGTF